MGKFILKRIGYGIITLIIIITITFFLIHAIPGDPMQSGSKHLPEEAMRAFKGKYGLDQPVPVQYGRYMKGLMFKGDLGTSLVHIGRSVNGVIKEFAPVSGKFGIRACILQIIIGLLLGIIAAFKRDTWADRTIMVLIILGICIPSFVFASLLQYFFGVKLKVLPVFGWGEHKHMVLPIMALVIGGVASYCKYMRNSTLGVIGEDYILTAEAKGVSTPALVFRHILRNAILPIITMIAPHIIGVFTGSFVIEQIFSIPGLGSYFVTAVNDSDYSMILGLTIFASALYIVSLIVVDILYALADPRIRITDDNE